MPQMKRCNSQYGAPMGRTSFGLIQNCEARTVRLFRVNLDSGGYDDGGAYWGHGELIFCATDAVHSDAPLPLNYFATVRASNRVHAALLLNIRPEQLRFTLGACAWLRWRAVVASVGRIKPVIQVEEFGHVIGYMENWDALCHFAQTCQYTQGSGLVRGEGLHLYEVQP